MLAFVCLFLAVIFFAIGMLTKRNAARFAGSKVQSASACRSAYFRSANRLVTGWLIMPLDCELSGLLNVSCPLRNVAVAMAVFGHVQDLPLKVI